jgi:hypothetical protein
MPKLHELLAVEGQLKGQVDKVRTELGATLEKKRHLFEAKVGTFHSNEEGVAPVTENQSDIQSTIPSELTWITGIWTKALDTSYQVAEANTKARADVILDNGTVLLKNVPATALLELEKRAAEIQNLIKVVPTLDPAKGFKLDPSAGKFVSVAREVRKNRTKKTQRPIVLYPATAEHPAQTQLLSEDVVVGTVVEQEWSGLITPTRKADLLERAEELRRAFKTARQRANDTAIEVASATCGAAIFGFVFKD